MENSDSEDSEDSLNVKVHTKGMKRVKLPLESPLAVLVCSGLVALPRLLQVLELFKHGGGKLSDQSDEWLRSGRIPLELDLGPRFHFHSSFTCAVSRDQTHKDNPPMLLPCGHAICK
ncbi:zinc finger, C3HC4 type (RING finger) domain-containing protein [Cardiosporidium cionae]|uniref:Zinc finger, C3HC4 type (RING finger) domain-containing protein n=1 Tax=Cardiosporidium cionae TaxID=476202 RepID=A0ABQ7J628_9APIC|nr:zinc finger, C3HC4 type (RING finger) domain-containing protein [Cardiosporidium cionae]|eukprot:KAF8819454.1 zinc finger, C3HC4 type (RING finger) domain-containing protein [Cardiosporidium cionae]